MTELLFPHANRDTLIVSGPDRLTWLNGLVTCDVTKLRPGVGAWGLALSSTGKIQSDLWLLASPERVFVSVAPGTGANLAQELGKRLVMEDAELVAASERYTWLTVHGANAARLASELAARCEATAHGTIGLVQANDAGLVVDRENIPQSVVLALSALTARTTLGAPEDWQAVRIEGGLPLYGVDYDGRSNPHDVSLERRAVSWSKGCYLGQEVVCMQDLRGKAKRRMVPLVLESTQAAVGAPVAEAAGGEQVGELTSCAFSARLGKQVAMAMIRAGHEASTELVVQGSPARLLAGAGIG